MIENDFIRIYGLNFVYDFILYSFTNFIFRCYLLCIKIHYFFKGPGSPRE